MSASPVTGTTLHWEHGRDAGLAGGIYGGAIEEPPKPRRSQVSLLQAFLACQGTDPGLHRCCWKLGTDQSGCGQKDMVYFTTLL